MAHYEDHQYEPSREMKQRYLATRKHDPTIGATPHPGLFQTANVFGDAFGLILALGLEGYGLANLMRIGSIEITAALALVAVDILGALLAHFRQGNLCRIRCLLAVTDDPSERARLRHRNSIRDRAIRSVGSLMISGSAAWKIVSFSSIGSLNETPAAIVALMGLVYISAAFLHWRCTGYAIAHAWLVVGLELERRRTLGEDPATAKCGLHGSRQLRFESRLPLLECTVNGNALIAFGAQRYTLCTTGLFLDHDLATLAARQDCPEARDIVSRHGLRGQMAMLDAEPLRPSKNSEAIHPANNEPRDSNSTCNGSERRAAALARHAALLLLSTVFLSGFSGCGNPPQSKKTVEMKLIVPASALTEEHKLPAEVVDLVAPEKIVPSNVKTPVVIPTISVFVTDGAYQPVTIKPKTDAGVVLSFWGLKASAKQQIASIREQLLALKLEPITTTADGSTEIHPAANFSMESLVFDKEGKLHSKALAFKPGATDTHPIKVGDTEMPTFGDATEISRAIADAVAVGESKFTLLYAAKDLLSPQPTVLAQAVEEKPTVAPESPLEELPSKPRILSLNADYSHAALVDRAESQLVIKFNSGSSELSFDAVKEIEHLAKKAATIDPAAGQWIVIGYADGKGTEELRDHLSRDRGLRTAAEMSSCGMKVAIVAGAGSTRPAGPNETSTGRAQNRRVIIYWKPSTAAN